MSRNADIWTLEARNILYQIRTKRFGPYSSSPLNGEEYQKFLSEFANSIGASSADAVEMQIRFAVQTTGILKEQTQTAILNKSAALEAGFIEDKDLPNLILVPRGDDKLWDWIINMLNFPNKK